MPSRNEPVILIICGDPGGANAIVPVIKQLLAEKKRNVNVFTYLQAIDIMNNNNISFSILDERITDSAIEEIIQENKPAIIVTGTSFNPIGFEKRFILAARELNIPTLAVLDFWSNYSLRFCNDETGFNYVPDKIAIMDNLAYNDMIAEGFNPDTLIVTGQPAFDALANDKLHFNDNKCQKIRSDFQIPSNELFVVFLSQPLSMLYGDDKSNPLFRGYTEKTVLKNLIKTLEKITQIFNTHLTLLIRPHPREQLNEYENFSSDHFRIIVSKGGNPREIVMSSDLVIGMNTELLVEACYLGCIVVSLQPNLNIKDALLTNVSGHSIPVYSEEKSFNTITIALFDSTIRSEMKNKLDHFIQDGHATDKVVKTIYQMMGKQQ